MKTTYRYRKYILFSLIFGCFSVMAGAQDYSKSLDGITKIQIRTETSIVAKGYDGDKLLIKESENYQSAVPEKSKGLRSMTSIGNDNTGYGINLSQNESLLILKGLRDRVAPNLVIYLPKGMDISLETVDNNDLFVDNFISEIEVKTNNGDIYINNVTGPIVAENRVGEIMVSFDTLSQDAPISLVAINGDIDVRLPEKTQADLTVKTPLGEFFTDFDLKINKGQSVRTSERRTLKSSLNGGGVSILLQTLKGNIYLRKK